MNIETSFAPLLDLLVKSAALILLGTALLVAIRKSSAANRHAVSVAIFAGLLLLPLTKLISARWSFSIEKTATPAVIVRLPLIVPAPSSDRGESASPVENAAPAAPRAPLVIPWKKLAFALWLAGAALLLAARALVAMRLRSIVRRSFPIEDERLAAKVRSLMVTSDVSAEVRVSGECRVPLASGIVRPVVLLPAEAAEWSDASISSALRHELGHICRRDCVTRLLADVLCAFYWVNPLVWFAARQMRLAQEQACDDLVLNAGASADEYAEQLVDVVRSLQEDRFTARHALAMAQPSTLETRVLAIVDTQRDRSARSVRGAVAGFAFVVAALALSTAAQLRGADEKKPAPAANASAPIRKQILIEAKFVEITGDNPALQAVLKRYHPTASAVGILTKDEAGEVLRALNQPKGVDLLSAPRVTTLTNQPASIEVVRDIIFPTEWEKDPKTGILEVTVYDARDVGVKLGITTDTTADGSITLKMEPEVVEFEGFVDLDAHTKAKIGKADEKLPADKRWLARADLSKIPKGHRTKPVFNVRKMEGSVTLRPEQTAILGGMEKVDVQTVEDRNPKTGRTKTTEVRLTRRLFVLVSARVLKPDEVPAEKPADVPGNPAGKTGAATGTKPLDIVSDKMTFDQKTGTLSASGNVRIETAEATIAADAVEITPKNAAAQARGADEEKSAPAEAVPPGPPIGSEAMFLRQWKVPPGLFQPGNVGDAGKSAVQDSLEKKGITFSAGATVVFKPERSAILVRNTQAQLDRIERFIADSVKSADTPGAPADAAAPAGESKREGALIFPSVEFRDATVRECVDFLVAKSKRIDPKGAGVNILLRDAEKLGDLKITLTLKNIPLVEVLRYVAGLANCELVREKFAFVIRPMQAGKVPVPDAPAAPVPAEPKGAALKKADAIIFPKIELRDATLSETVDFLRKKSKELDPDKQGVNVILQPLADGEEPRITISFTNIPLSEALRYVAGLAGCEIAADEHAITLRPRAK